MSMNFSGSPEGTFSGSPGDTLGDAAGNAVGDAVADAVARVAGRDWGCIVHDEIMETVGDAIDSLVQSVREIGELETHWWDGPNCESGLPDIPDGAIIDFNNPDNFTKYVKDCPCNCKNANAHQFSGWWQMKGTTVAKWNSPGYHFIFNRKCSCVKTSVERPVWRVHYRDSGVTHYGWNRITPGTCNEGTLPSHDYAPDRNYYRGCFAHDLCLLEVNDAWHCAYLSSLGLAGHLHNAISGGR